MYRNFEYQIHMFGVIGLLELNLEEKKYYLRSYYISYINKL